MKKYINITLATAALIGLTGCGEEPFGPGARENGKLSREALSLELQNKELLMSRATDLDVNDCAVEIVSKADQSVAASYRYGEMPEIITLPEGEYTVRASYGENPTAAWDAPYYYGESDFSIEAAKITYDIAPVVCKLSNIKVTIVFDDTLASKMGPDAKVTVKAGKEGSLDYYVADMNKAGFFAFEDGASLVATFSGMIDGNEIVESKTYDTAVVGAHYTLTFRLNTFGGSDPGTIGSDFTVNASVTKQPLVGDIDPDAPLEKDDMRPVENFGEGPDTPPDDPKVDLEKAIAVEGKGFDIKVRQDADNLTAECVINITTEKPIEKFDVKIDSETGLKDAIADMGLLEFSLSDPNGLEEVLGGFGFKYGEEVKDQTEVPFILTEFMPLLGAFGAGNHDFTLIITTADGTREVTFMVYTK